jgi:DNA polymerase-1
VFAVDTETTSVQPVDAELVGLSFSWKSSEGWYVPVMGPTDDVLSVEQVREQIGPILADPKITKVGHNIKYDLNVLRVAEMPIGGPLFDTMIASFTLDSARRSHGMDRLVFDHFGHQMIPISELLGKGREQRRMDEVALADIAEYAAEDADFTWRMMELFKPRLDESDRAELFYDTEMPLVEVLAEMEFNGITLDSDLLAGMGRQMSKRAEAISEEVYKLAGTRFNLDSPKQLSEVLFDKLEFRVVKRTKTTRSTDAETLETLARETGHALPALLIEYREIQKLRGTYIDALPACISPRTGRVHTSYHQTGAITGRLSSSEPNLQNIPVRTELGREIRRAFVPRSRDEQLIVADYSQIELRILAHFCQDESLMQAFVEDLDVHAFVAAQVNGVELEDVTREMRSRAKAVNFGIIYGQTAFGLARGTGMSRSEAQAFIDGYFARYPKIRSFIDQCIESAKQQGYVSTLLGRRRDIADIESRNPNQRALAERLAVNTVVQGSAADMIKVAMNKLHAWIREEELPLRMLLQVHDELVCESPRESAKKYGELVADVMSHAIELSVPIKVDVSCADNWLEAK